ncbi:MAG: sirohydrochlorin chelatase [Pseudonocardia sp.]|nr:sirohydrochlorin chelatase [Pseudonocardia sp.]
MSRRSAGAFSPPLVLVAHGTRDGSGAVVARRLTDRVARRLGGIPVRLAFVAVRPPTVVDALADLPGCWTGAVVVPAFLAAGYHVRHDLPGQLAAAGLADRVLLAPPLGPDPLLVTVAVDRLLRAGWRGNDTTVLAAAGSTDPVALADVSAAAAALGQRLGTGVRVGYLAAGAPRVAELVAELRSARRRVAVASWLLAPGLFQRRLADSGADIVANPLGVHAAVVETVVARYQLAVQDFLAGSHHLVVAAGHRSAQVSW